MCMPTLPGAIMHLNVDRHRLDALERNRAHARNHAAPPDPAALAARNDRIKYPYASGKHG